MVELDKYPSFITIDGGEGGTGQRSKNYKMVLITIIYSVTNCVRHAREIWYSR